MSLFAAALLQGYIVLSACAAVWLLARDDGWRRWGFVVGLAGQPAWIYSTLAEGQFGMLVVAVFFAWVYGKGVWLNFVRPPVIYFGKGL